MGAYFVRPSSAPHPGIVLLQEVFGVNTAMRQKAALFAEQGFAVLVPDLFWRIRPNVQLGYDAAGLAQASKMMQAFNFKLAIADIKRAFAYLAASDETVGAPAFVGFCLGGKMAVLAGFAEPGASAVVSFYGVAIDRSMDRLTNLVMPAMLHFGSKDTHIPKEQVDRIGEAIRDKPQIQMHVYDGAQHGFFNRGRTEVYDPVAADTAFQRTLTFLRSVQR